MHSDCFYQLSNSTDMSCRCQPVFCVSIFRHGWIKEQLGQIRVLLWNSPPIIYGRLARLLSSWMGQIICSHSRIFLFINVHLRSSDSNDCVPMTELSCSHKPYWSTNMLMVGESLPLGRVVLTRLDPLHSTTWLILWTGAYRNCFYLDDFLPFWWTY